VTVSADDSGKVISSGGIGKVQTTQLGGDPERPDEDSGTMRRMPASEIAAYVEEELGVATTRGDVYENKRTLEKLRETRPRDLGNTS
jgi:hypothetical protein